MSDPVITLASASPRRAELLRQLGVEFSVFPVDCDETVLTDESARDYVVRVTESKAGLALDRVPDGLVMAADTSVVLGGRIYGKPTSFEDACSMLHSLSGKTHQVMTSVCVASRTRTETICQISHVTFCYLTEEWIDWYWKTGEPCDKAGAYAIQGYAASKISHLEGSYSGVMGLPLYETAELLRAFGIQLQGSDLGQ